MKVDFSQPITNLEGKPFQEDNKDLTLAAIAVGALLASYQDEAALSGEEKFQRYALSTRIHKSGSIEVSVEEISKLKTLIGKMFGPSIVGPAYDLLEGRTITKASSGKAKASTS